LKGEKNINIYLKALKIALGSTIAIIIAYSLNLNYFTSAGIITLLTLQNTTKETMIAAVRKILAFVISVFISYIVFKTFSYNLISYGIFLLIFIISCNYIKMYEAIPINAVLATHFLLEKDMSLLIISNEGFLMLIGAGTGILLNLYIPSNIKFIRNEQEIIERDFKNILICFANNIINKNKSDFVDTCFESLNKHIESGIKQAKENMNNTFFRENKYFLEYMKLRRQQYKVLEEILLKIKTLTSVPSQAYEVSDFIILVSDSLSESQEAKGLLLSLEDLMIKFKESPLPVSREEFENRAILYMVLMDLKVLIKMKENFADSLTKEQIKLYWRE